MKKDIEWLVQTINAEREILRQRFESGKETADECAFNDGRDWALLFVLRLIEHMGEQEPEVLTQEWIDEHSKAVTYDGIPDQTEVVYVDDLEKILKGKGEINE